MRINLLLALLFISLCANAQNPVLRGKIDKYPIVMEWQIKGNTYNARYFYESMKTDIELTGRLWGSKLHLESGDEKGGKEVFDLDITNVNAMTGTWKKGTKVLSVELAGAYLKTINHPGASCTYIQDLLTKDPYLYVMTSLLPIKVDSVITKRDYELTYKSIPKTGVYTVNFSNPGSPDAMQRINSRMDKEMYQQAIAFFECKGRAPGDMHEYTMNIDQVFCSKGVISLHTTNYFDCGGAHPSVDNQSLNFNAVTGDELVLEDVLHLLYEPAPADPQSSAWISYRGDKYGPKLMELISHYFGKHLSEDKECDYDNADYWTFANFNFTAEGLLLQPQVPHSMQHCDSPEWCVILYAELGKYLDKKKNVILP